MKNIERKKGERFIMPEKFRVTPLNVYTPAGDAGNGMFKIPVSVNGTELIIGCIASDGLGWEHVSVNCIHKGISILPNWDVMAFIKSLFLEPESRVIQIHPPESQYVNNHPNVLHLWRCRFEDAAYPMSMLVGIVNKTT